MRPPVSWDAAPVIEHDVGFAEMFGLRPLGPGLRQAKMALLGAEDVPGSRFGLSSLKLLRPKVALPLWRGKSWRPRTVLITTLFNHTPTPIEEGWSVKKTQVQDFRGRDLTYDSHNGTDLSIPVGTPVHTAGAGEVVRVVSEFNRGGLKVFIDHGEGLMTTYAHLARVFVEEGQRVERGQRVALSGYSGIDGFTTFPLGVPHVHFNVWLNGVPIDPFPRGSETSMWRGGRPSPIPVDVGSEPFEPSRYVAEHVDNAIRDCVTASVRDRLVQVGPLSVRAGHLLAESNYYPTRFPRRPMLYDKEYARSERIDLPFSARDFDEVVFIDELP